MYKFYYDLYLLILRLTGGGDCHLAVGAVEAESEAAAVVQQEQRPRFFCALMNRAEAEFVADAVAGTHQGFGSPCIFGRF